PDPAVASTSFRQTPQSKGGTRWYRTDGNRSATLPSCPREVRPTCSRTPTSEAKGHQQVHDSRAGFRFDPRKRVGRNGRGNINGGTPAALMRYQTASRSGKPNLSLDWFPTPFMVRGLASRLRAGSNRTSGRQRLQGAPSDAHPITQQGGSTNG